MNTSVFIKNDTKQNLPKITVITPVKNSVRTIEVAILSLIKQNYPNLEYIILDGKSTDGTIDIIKKYNNFITYWQSEKDDGSVDAYIKGIELANSDIIAFLNADDFYEEGTLLKAGEEFIKNPDADIISFRFKVLSKKNNDYKILSNRTAAEMELNKNKIIQAFGINARFFKKNLFKKYGMPLAKDDQGRSFISNDIEYMIRFVLNNIKNKTIDQVGYNYVAHEKSLTFSKKVDTTIRLCEDKIFIAQKFLKEKDLEIPQIWQKTFVKWIKKYRASIVKLQIKQGNFKNAILNFTLGIKESGFINFTFYFLKTLFRK